MFLAEPHRAMDTIPAPSHSPQAPDAPAAVGAPDARVSDAAAPRPAPLRLAVIVTEFPKTTETFIMRDVMDLHRMGCEIRIFHLTPFNRNDTIHAFAAPTLAWAHDYPFLLSREVLGATAHFAWTRSRVLLRSMADILRGCRRDPVMMLKSLFILPKSLRIARALQAWDCQHVHAAYAGHPTTAAWLAARVTGIPFSLSSHAHDLFETQALLAEKLPEAQFVRTISQYNREFILRHVPALADNPPQVIHVGTYLDAPPAERERAAGTFRILYVGSLERRKGVDLLLQAVARLGTDDWRLDVLGGGPETEQLKRQTADLGIDGRVTFHGPKRNEDVIAAMAEASVLAVPSRIGPRNQTEGLPTVIVEALSQGLPVVATRLTGIPEIVQHGRTGLLFDIEDVDGIVGALEAVRTAPDAAEERSSAGRKLVEQEFDQRKNARVLLDLIRQRVLPGAVA